MNDKSKLTVSEIQRFCMHDGPGIRTTVFLKGCPLRCDWCHNPETQKSKPELLFYANKCIGCLSCVASCPNRAQTAENGHTLDRGNCTACAACVQTCPSGALELCGKEMQCSDILSVVEKDIAFYGENGGITLSGGEPFAQGRALLDLLAACKEKGLHTALETCGYADTEILRMAIPMVDLFLWDIKDTNDEIHKKYTGDSSKKILENLAFADANGAKIRLRCILVNGINTEKEHYKGIAQIALSLSNCEGVELIPYHAYAGTKLILLGGEDNGRKEWIPNAEQIDKAKNTLRNMGVFVF